MTIPAWPTALPQSVITDGYSERMRDGRAFAQTSSGVGKGRRRYSSAVMPVSCAAVMTYAQKSRFETFWAEDTGGGVLPFTIRDQSHDGHPLLDENGDPVLDEDDEPIIISATWLVRFGRDPPQIAPWGLNWMVSFQLDVLP
jgi:hypothetical protein